MDTILSYAADEGVMNLALGLLALVVGWALRSWWVRKWRLGKLVEFAQVAVGETYREYVKVKKAADEWDDTAKEMARDKALVRLKELALSEGKGLLKHYAKEYLPTLIEWAVSKNKYLGKLAQGAIKAGGPFLGPELPSA